MAEVSLDALLLQPAASPDISAIIKHKDFITYLLQGKPLLIQFIIRNFDRILEIIFEEHHKDEREIRPLLLILECKEINVKRALVTSTKFVKYILEYPNRIKVYNPPSAAIYFNSLMLFILDNNGDLLPFFANRDFFEDIIRNCDIQEAFIFMKTALSSRNKSFEIFFSRINIPSILILYCIGNDGVNLNVIKLFESVVDKYPVQCADAVIQSDIINHLINSAFMLNCSQLIDFINFLYSVSYKFKMESQWFNIEFIIDDRIPEICDYLLSTTKFDQMCKASANILLTYLRERHQQFPKIVYVTKKFTEELFNNPTNSFLHNTAYAFISSLKEFPSKFDEVVVSTNLCFKILECYKRRNTDTGSCYWGHLRKISELIDNPVNVNLTEWQNYVVNPNLRKEKIIQTQNRVVKNGESINSKDIGSIKTKKFHIPLPHISFMNIVSFLVCFFAIFLFYLNHRND